MKQPNRIFAAVAVLLAVGSSVRAQSESADLRSQVAEVERAFAKTMADRDYDAFTSFLSEEAVFEESAPPFSWEPETVSVLDSGKLAISTGAVWNAEGRRTSTYTSIWRQEEPGVWRIIFDKGDRYCE